MFQEITTNCICFKSKRNGENERESEIEKERETVQKKGSILMRKELGKIKMKKERKEEEVDAYRKGTKCKYVKEISYYIKVLK